jgi:membrane fusion protein (multidrug efflux system)
MKPENQAPCLCLGSRAFFAALLAGGLFLFSSCGNKKPAAAPPPPKVLVMQVQPQRVEILDEIVATLDGSANTDVRSQVAGYLQKQHYKDGAEVRQGDLLFEIDPRPFQIAVLKAQADMESALAHQVKTEQEEIRSRQLIEANAISRQDLEAAIMANSAAKAQVRALDAILERAYLELSYTRITAPISGVAGSALPGPGDLISPSQTLTTISTLDPIRARFTISETVYLKYVEQITRASTQPEAEKRALFELVLADGSVHPHRGWFDFIDRQVQTGTGALTVSALFPNPEKVLRPGLFARVRLVAEARPDALAVPQRAVMEQQGRMMIAVVREDNTVEIRPVRVGPRSGNLWVIEEGLSSGETVVVEGVQKCRPGQPVSPQPWTASGAEPHN